MTCFVCIKNFSEILRSNRTLTWRITAVPLAGHTAPVSGHLLDRLSLAQVLTVALC